MRIKVPVEKHALKCIFDLFSSLQETGLKKTFRRVPFDSFVFEKMAAIRGPFSGSQQGNVLKKKRVIFIKMIQSTRT